MQDGRVIVMYTNGDVAITKKNSSFTTIINKKVPWFFNIINSLNLFLLVGLKIIK